MNIGRRLAASLRTGKPSRTSGKEKGGTCVRTDLKTWGMNQNPWKLRGGNIDKYEKYCELTKGLNK